MVRDVEGLAAICGRFAISHSPDRTMPSGGNWLELLASGLTFDLAGLEPGEQGSLPPQAYAYGVDSHVAQQVEAVTLRPGPHLTGGATMIPVVRILASLAADLSQLAGVEAIAWHPARCWSAPRQFCTSVNTWLSGGPFPVFSLAAIAPTPDGGLQSEGLSLFTGQELRIEPELAEDRAAGSKVAVRALHYLSERGPLSNAEFMKGPNGLQLKLEPSVNQRFVRIWKG